MRVALAFLLAPPAVLPVACGARTQLPVGPADGAPASADASDEAAPGVQSGSPCNDDADCAADRFCVESAHCDPTSGCVLVARSCDDGIDCTRDRCSDAQGRCDHVGDDSLCSDAQLCSFKRGCDAFVYAVASDGHLYEARIPSGELVDVGMSNAQLSELALGSNSVLYGTDSYVLYRVDRATSIATAIASILPLHQYNGLGVVNGSSLLATADVPQVFAVDAVNGSSRVTTSLPDGYTRSGDVTGLGSRILVAAGASGNPSTDTLVEVPSTGGANVVGDFGYRCVWGLATLGGVAYGLTCEGRILSIDAARGTAREIARVRPAFTGAAGR
jgi:hypothetical protein